MFFDWQPLGHSPLPEWWPNFCFPSSNLGLQHSPQVSSYPSHFTLTLASSSLVPVYTYFHWRNLCTSICLSHMVYDSKRIKDGEGIDTTRIKTSICLTCFGKSQNWLVALDLNSVHSDRISSKRSLTIASLSWPENPLASNDPLGWGQIPRTSQFQWSVGISQAHMPKQIEERRGADGETKRAFPSSDISTAFLKSCVFKILFIQKCKLLRRMFFFHQ